MRPGPDSSKALEPLPSVDDANLRLYGGHKHSSRGHTTTMIKHDLSSSSTLPPNLSASGIAHQIVKQVQPTVVSSNIISSQPNPTNSSTTFHTASITSLQHLPPSFVQNLPANPVIFQQNGTPITMGNAGVAFQLNQQMFKQNRSGPSNISQTDGQCDDMTKSCEQKQTKSKKKAIQISFQLDGTVVPAISDDDDEDDNDEEPLDQVEDEEDETNEEGNEDPKPLCSEDDVSEDEPNELFECDNVVVCQYDKINRCKNKWRFTLKSGIMNIQGRDYVFSRSTGEATW
ncbi:unnamed protein product [Didymodactylos carnosus]|nr:unnamed protein product [Didymodactylos carnosus]CAF3805060.1 unnamed protein product [Didymodactylos carnosus]